MHQRGSSTPSHNSHACQDMCECALCIRDSKKNDTQSQPDNTPDILLPNEIAYKFLCDQIVDSPINHKLNFSIMDTFFFEGHKIVGYYHNNQDGRMVCSSVRGFKEVEKRLRNKKYVPIQPPSCKLQRRFETAKQAVNRKLKNNIGIMVMKDGSFKFLNELNISFQMNTSQNVSFIKPFHSCRLIPVYYKHKQLYSKELYKRARIYLKALFKEITPFEINYITKQDQYRFQQDLYKQNIQKYLTYLCCKLCHLVLADDCLLIRSGTFVWAVDSQTTAVYLSNAHQIRYSIEKDPNEVLERFINNKKKRVERKLQSLNKQTLDHDPSLRMKGFQKFLQESFKMAVDELAPKIQTNTRQSLQINQIFKKLHPQVNYNLSDIVSNNSRFNAEMKKLFSKRVYKQKQVPKMGIPLQYNKSINAENRKYYNSTNTIIVPSTSRKLKKIRSSSNKKEEEETTCRKTTFYNSCRIPRITTQFSSKKLCL